jgi:DNA-binding Lrp family transcriptional regulator
MNDRIKKRIDGMDRDILRFLYGDGIPKPRTTHQISKRVNLSPPAVSPRLKNLQSQGIVKPFSIGKSRNFQRTFGKTKVNIKAPSKIFWGLDIKKRK